MSLVYVDIPMKTYIYIYILYLPVNKHIVTPHANQFDGPPGLHLRT